MVKISGVVLLEFLIALSLLFLLVPILVAWQKQIKLSNGFFNQRRDLILNRSLYRLSMSENIAELKLNDNFMIEEVSSGNYKIFLKNSFDNKIFVLRSE